MSTLDRSFIKAFAEVPRLDERACAAQTAEPASPSAACSRTPSPATERILTLDPSATVPLSSFAAPPPARDASRPMLEVDRLNLPPAVTELVTRSVGRQWEAFTSQLLDRAAQGSKCIAVAGQHRSEGRTTLCLALARHAASRGLRPVLVDADAENPALARSCGVSAQMGWNDLVSSELAVGEALILAVEDGLTLLPWRGTAMGLGEMSRARRTAAIFADLRDQYDLTLVDAGPLAGRSTVADLAALAGAARIDGMYLVHNVRSTTRDDLAAICARLKRAGLAVAGVIENFAADEESAVPARGAGRAFAVRS